MGGGGRACGTSIILDFGYCRTVQAQQLLGEAEASSEAREEILRAKRRGEKGCQSPLSTLALVPLKGGRALTL